MVTAFAAAVGFCCGVVLGVLLASAPPVVVCADRERDEADWWKRGEDFPDWSEG